ncbi:aminotransferase class I/II-fold pyridoxal phosphate-dependent enzyme, partial [Bacillus subtilis]
ENTWPYRAERFAVANGGYVGTLLALRAIVQPGTPVAVEQPTAPRILETLRAVKATPIAVQCDSEGPMPDAVSAALDRRPSVLIYQPRAQIPSGCTVSARRVHALAEIIRQARHQMAVLEDDNVGPAAGKIHESIGTILPEHTIVVRSYCKTYGIDLRTCVISGPVSFSRRIHRLQALSMIDTSRILQNALAYLLRDPATEQRLDTARARYRQRRVALATQLTQHGVSVAEGAGLALWVSVADERIAMNSLLRRRIMVGRGSECTIGGNDTTHLQVATAALPDDLGLIDDLARAIAAAALPARVPAAG